MLYLTPILISRLLLFAVCVCLVLPVLSVANAAENNAAPQAAERSLLRPWTWFRSGNPGGYEDSQQGQREVEQERERERDETAAEQARNRDVAEPRQSRESGEASAPKGRERGFTEADRERLQNVPEASLPPGLQRRQSQGRGLPAGLQRRVDRGEGLPAGWANRVQVGKPLPKDIDKSASMIPPEIREQLPKAPEGVQDILVEDQIIRVIEQTREVIDSLRIGKRAE